MTTNQTAPKNIDEYIASFPPNVQEILEQVRRTIRAAAPEAEETISYQMPTFTLNGRYLVYFAAYRNHIGLYPAPIGVEELKEELSVYGGGKGTVRFPLDKPLPLELIKKIVKFRVAENLKNAEVKSSKTKVTKKFIMTNNKKQEPIPESDFPTGLARPAQRALAGAGYVRLEQLTGVSEDEILKLHGMGPKALDQLRRALAAKGLSFAGSSGE